MVSMDSSDMPRQLGNGLLLRWAEQSDAEELAEFNLRYHSEDPGGQPELWLKSWTKDLLSGRHPTASVGNITVVVDENSQSKIISSMALIPQVWAYEDLTFGCGRPELIATNPDYRRRGLVRYQFDVIHAQSAARNDLVQAITGIPWYYRQFGYEMALDLGGGRVLPIADVKELPTGEDEQYILQKANFDDLPFLKKMYAQLCTGNLMSCIRDDAVWEYELEDDPSIQDGRRNLWIIKTLSDIPAAYAAIKAYPRADAIFELEVAAGHSVLAITSFITRQLKDAARNADPKQPLGGIAFKLGANHPAYDALHGQIREPMPSYAWFLRVPDLPRFLWHISQVLEQRLSESVIAGFSGSLNLNFYQRQLKIDFNEGKLTQIEQYEPNHFFDGDAFFSGDTFLQLLFGYRTMDELHYAHVDCFASGGQVTVLLQALFPKKHSKVVPIS